MTDRDTFSAISHMDDDILPLRRWAGVLGYPGTGTSSIDPTDVWVINNAVREVRKRLEERWEQTCENARRRLWRPPPAVPPSASSVRSSRSSWHGLPIAISGALRRFCVARIGGFEHLGRQTHRSRRAAYQSCRSGKERVAPTPTPDPVC